MPGRISVKCAITPCHRRLRMTLAGREQLRQAGRENGGTAGIMCPEHVKAVFNFEDLSVDIDVPLEELLVESLKETPRWRVLLSPLSQGPESQDGAPAPRTLGKSV